MKSNRGEFYSTLVNLFGIEHLKDEQFLNWLCSKINAHGEKWRLKQQIKTWIRNECTSLKGRKHSLLSKEDIQAIYNEWMENSVQSTDRRNGKSTSRIPKLQYLQLYKDVDAGTSLKEEKSKTGKTYLVAEKKIASCTVRNLREKLLRKNIEVCNSTIQRYKPFFMSEASDRELQVCMCKMCLNNKLLFDKLHSQAKSDNEAFDYSISDFFMHGCECDLSDNGYYQLKCIEGKCRNCKKNTAPIQLKCLQSQKLIPVGQYESVKEKYKKLNKTTGQLEEKESTKTKKVMKKMTYKEIYITLTEQRAKYMLHKYQLKNDRLHWPKILSTINEYGPIFHLDFSENLQQQYKFEAQSCHFNKTQYSLHCTVVHEEEDHNIYVFHLSDDKKHDAAFVKQVLEDLVSIYPADIIRLKSDNCSCQYKCGKVFECWCQLAKELSKVILVYFGVSGHGKGLVAAMSAFGVKNPLKRAVIFEKYKKLNEATGELEEKEFHYSNSFDIFEWLSDTYKEKQNWKYIHVEQETLAESRKDLSDLPLKGSSKFHMICFRPDGSILSKDNICSCAACLEGEFLN